jgi:hypothetical protein
MKAVSEMHEENRKRLRTLFLLELSYEVCALTVHKVFAYEYSDNCLPGNTTVDEISYI